MARGVFSFLRPPAVAVGAPIHARERCFMLIEASRARRVPPRRLGVPFEVLVVKDLLRSTYLLVAVRSTLGCQPLLYSAGTEYITLLRMDIPANVAWL